jgi:hypothetical protein
MRLRPDGMYELTWKEALGTHLDVFPVPRWKKTLAPLQHWFACTFQGHESRLDAGNAFLSESLEDRGHPPVPGYAGAPWPDPNASFN